MFSILYIKFSIVCMLHHVQILKVCFKDILQYRLER